MFMPWDRSDWALIFVAFFGTLSVVKYKEYKYNKRVEWDCLRANYYGELEFQELEEREIAQVGEKMERHNKKAERRQKVKAGLTEGCCPGGARQVIDPDAPRWDDKMREELAQLKAERDSQYGGFDRTTLAKPTHSVGSQPFPASFSWKAPPARKPLSFSQPARLVPFDAKLHSTCMQKCGQPACRDVNACHRMSSIMRATCLQKCIEKEKAGLRYRPSVEEAAAAQIAVLEAEEAAHEAEIPGLEKEIPALVARAAPAEEAKRLIYASNSQPLKYDDMLKDNEEDASSKENERAPDNPLKASLKRPLQRLASEVPEPVSAKRSKSPVVLDGASSVVK